MPPYKKIYIYRESDLPEKGWIHSCFNCYHIYKCYHKLYNTANKELFISLLRLCLPCMST